MSLLDRLYTRKCYEISQDVNAIFDGTLDQLYDIFKTEDDVRELQTRMDSLSIDNILTIGIYSND